MHEAPPTREEGLRLAGLGRHNSSSRAALTPASAAHKLQSHMKNKYGQLVSNNVTFAGQRHDDDERRAGGRGGPGAGRAGLVSVGTVGGVC